MWDSLSWMYLAHVYASMYYIVQSLVYWMHYSLYFVSAGIGMPPPPLVEQVLTHKRACHICKSRLLRVFTSSALVYLIFLSL